MIVKHTYNRRLIGIVVTAFAFTSIVLTQPDTAGSSTIRKMLGKLEITVGPSVWYSLGEAGFKGDDDGWRWELEYPLNGWMTEIGAESRFPLTTGHPGFGASLRARYARSNRFNGTSSDTDWDSRGIKDYYSEADCEADIIMWHIEVSFSILVPRQMNPRMLAVGALAGYGVRRFEFTDIDLHVMVSDRRPRETQYPGVSAYYDMEFRTGRVGLFADFHTPDKLRYYLEATYMPYLKASADALWVLRNYPFWQEAEGSGYSLIIRSSYTAWGRLSFLIGFRLVSLVANHDAVEGGVLDGTPYENEPYVSEITSKYSGIEGGVLLRF